nr:ankyrin repeat and zinc finger domain containing protein [Hymenolepis microstoma]
MNGLLLRDNGCTCDKISYFNRKCSVEYLTGIIPACDTLPTELAPVVPNPENPTVAYATSMKTFTCICCKLTFVNNEEQKAHFKSDEHAALVSKNMRRPESGGWLYETWSETDSDSSSESSESEVEEKQDKNSCELKVPDIARKDVVGSLAMFRNRRQEIIGIHRCLIRSREAPVKYFDDVLKRIELLRNSRFWAFLLYSGGKFAGAIFDEDRVVVHKTFHRYTVRAKQGGSQSVRDGALGGMSGHKSAGSALRRHGEIAIRSDIANLLHVKWRSYMQACQLILTITARRNHSIFTTPPSCCATSESPNVNDNEGRSSGDESGDKEPILASGPDAQAVEAVAGKMGLVTGDPRLRRLSGGARSISYAHIKELQAEFSKFRVYEPFVDLGLISLSDRRQMEEGVPMVFESKSGRLFYGTLPELLKNTPSSVSQKIPKESPESSNPPQAPSVEQPTVAVTATPSTSISRKKRRHRKNRQKRQETDGNQSSSTSDSKFDSDDSNDASTRRADEWMNTASSSRLNQSSPDKLSLNSTYDKYMRQILMATANRDEEDLQQLLTVPNPTLSAARGIEFPRDQETLHSILNSIQVWFGKGLLHTAVELGDDPDILDILLNAGCKLEVKDANGMTAYQLAEKIGKRKLTSHLRHLRTEYPDRYDYAKAGLPPLQSPGNPGGSTKKRGQPTAQATEVTTRKMDKPSMREKCAAAAEKRASQSQLKGKPPVTCNECSADMTGIEPFSYLNFVFCSPECMRKHRQQQNKR